MMSFAVQILENEKHILDQVRQKFTHIRVDEYQDINPIQEKLIQMLTGAKGNLCVVGDDDQSIYKWRGSKIENILTFSDRYKFVYRHHLPINYRSTGEIVSLSDKLIQINTRRLPKSMKDSGKVSENGDIYKVRFEKLSEETNFIARKIRELLGTEWENNGEGKRGLAYSDMAIFFRSVKFEAKPYLEALDKAGIPYTVSGVGGLFETPEVDLLFSIFAYLGDFEKESDEKKIAAEATTLFSLPEEKVFIKWLRKLKEEIKDQKRISLQGIYHDILNALQIFNNEHHDDSVEIRLYNLGRLSEAISDYETVQTYCTYSDIRRFCWFVRQFAEANYDYGAGDDPTRFVNAVQVMTLHGTKGLGFPAVFMPHCVERKPRKTEPGFLDPQKFDFSRYHGSEEDERRLFYVGMTRAKKFLFLTTSHNPGPRKHKKDPSRYFLELSDKGCVTSSSSDPIPRKRLKPAAMLEDYQFPTNYSELSAYL